MPPSSLAASAAAAARPQGPDAGRPPRSSLSSRAAAPGERRARARIGAAAEAGLVEHELRLVRVVRPAAARPRLGPEAAHERAWPPAAAARGDPLLDVAHHVEDAEGRGAPRMGAARRALPEPLDLALRHLAGGAELPLVDRPPGLAAVADRLVNAPAVGEGTPLGALARELPLLLGAHLLAARGAPRGRRLERLHDERLRPALVRRLELVHAHGDLGRRPLLGRDVLPVREAVGRLAALGRLHADVLHLVAVRAGDEPHVRRTRRAGPWIERRRRWQAEHRDRERAEAEQGIDHRSARARVSLRAGRSLGRAARHAMARRVLRRVARARW